MRRKEHSFGIIGLRVISDRCETLIVKHNKGHWGFPKGHLESTESSQEAAARELQEETDAVIIRFFDVSPLEERYFFKSEGLLVEKRVTYFLAEIEGEITLQKDEISEYRWASFKEAELLATFDECKQLCRQAAQIFRDCHFSI